MTYKKYGKSAFCFYGPTAWNKLPLFLRQASSVDIFKAQLKTYLFTFAFSSNWTCIRKLLCMMVLVLIELVLSCLALMTLWWFPDDLSLSYCKSSVSLIMLYLCLSFFLFYLFTLILLFCCCNSCCFSVKHFELQSLYEKRYTNKVY